MKKSAREKLLDITFMEVYQYGYCGASIANILKLAQVPKGSMYHHFSSKKEMVLVMITERLIPKVDAFFDFEMKKDTTATEIITHTLNKMAKNEMLIAHGCPLHRLMFEMGSLDEDIAKACQDEFEKLTFNLQKVLTFGIKNGEFRHDDPKSMSEFIIVSTWGILSRLPQDSSSTQFHEDTAHLLKYLKY